MNYLSISALTKYIKAKFERDPYLETVYLKGELSNVKHHSSGHLYFAVKDGGAVLNGMMYKSSVRNLNFVPKEGDEVLLTGRVSIYEARGSYQLYASEMSLDGIGQLFERFEKLKKEFKDKGYFDAAHKKELPKYPQRIAVLTASTGAAIRDIESTLRRRFPLAEVTIFSTIVQGVQAAPDIVRNIKEADKQNFDVMIVGRGGGSIEDLWAFNEESVVEAIYEAVTPIISGVGHETDTTLSDFVADLRAPTPTGAAVLATPDQMELMQLLKKVDWSMQQNVMQKLKFERERVTRLSAQRILRMPLVILEARQQKLDDYSNQTKVALKETFSAANERYIRTSSKMTPQQLIYKLKESASNVQQQQDMLNRLLKQALDDKEKQLLMQKKLLGTLNPTSILERGYSIVRHDTRIISSAQEVAPGDLLTIQLADGEIISEAKEIRGNTNG